MKIPFNKPFIVGKELYNIAQSVVNLHLSGDGAYTKLCHQWIQSRLGCREALLTNSCTAALEMAAILCDIEPGDEIIMPSFTFVSTANAFVLRGGIPVFIDIKPADLNIDEKLIEAAVTPKTKAVVPVHYAGVACEMDCILGLAKEKHLFVVEDAAQAFLSYYKGKALGTIGHLGCLSFHETKNIISGEGGSLLINDHRLIERAKIIREKGTNRTEFFQGKVDKYTWVDIGSSFLPSELIGAFLYAQLEQAEKIVEARCRTFSQYYEGLRHLSEKGFMRLPFVDGNSTNNGHIFYIIVRSREERTELINYLKEKSIAALFHYIPLHSSPAGRKYGRVSGAMTVTDDISERILRLPMFYEMNEEDLNMVIEAVDSFYKAM
jgi:dTDP-4-amino-4,6-dideoxygalactose transaminase